MYWIPYVLILFSGFFFFMFLSLGLFSLWEKEKTAALRTFVVSLLLPIPYILLAIFSFPHSEILALSLMAITMISGIVIIFPLPFTFKIANEDLDSQYDERDVIFVRNRLEPGSDNYKDYYTRREEKLEPDNRFRAEPGLLSPESLHADPLMFASTAASFITCENLIPLCNGPVNPRREDIAEEQISHYIKEWGKHLGAVSVGITRLKKDHLYSIGGRGEKYGETVKNNHQYAIAFTVEMDHDYIRKGPKAPAVMESAKQYLNAGTIAVQLASFIRELGYSARAHIDANYEVICPLVARDAGLGEIGRMGILMTPQLGPRVRVNVVTTEMPLITDERKYDGTMIEFCTYCRKCADVCPGRAIPEEDRSMDNGVLRWKINHEKCFTLWCKSGTDCGRCMAVCPYSHPQNFIHNTVRFLIKHSPVFRRIAPIMDDFLYGRKPKPHKLSKWQTRLVGTEIPARQSDRRSSS